MKKCELIHVGEKEGTNMKLRHAKLSETKKLNKCGNKREQIVS